MIYKCLFCGAILCTEHMKTHKGATYGSVVILANGECIICKTIQR